MDLQPVLLNSFVTLRPLQENDRLLLYKVASDPLIWEKHPQSNRYEKPVFDQFFDDAIASAGALLVTDSETRNVIGCTRYYDWNEQNKSVFIGYSFLSRSHWGTGHNGNIKTLMLNHAFQYADTVLFHVGETNVRSRKAVEKLGASLTGEKIEKRDPKGNVIFSLVYKISSASLPK